MQVQLTDLERALILDMLRKRAKALTAKHAAEEPPDFLRQMSEKLLQDLYHKLYGHGKLFKS